MSQLATVPVPDAFEVRTNATFEALLWALSRPGTLQDLPAPGMAELPRPCWTANAGSSATTLSLVTGLPLLARHGSIWPWRITAFYRWTGLPTGWRILLSVRRFTRTMGRLWWPKPALAPASGCA